MVSIAARQRMAEGEAKGRADVLLRQFRRKFGAVPTAVEERVRGTTGIDQLDAWSERVLDAGSLIIFSYSLPARRAGANLEHVKVCAGLYQQFGVHLYPRNPALFESGFRERCTRGRVRRPAKASRRCLGESVQSRRRHGARE